MGVREFSVSVGQRSLSLRFVSFTYDGFGSLLEVIPSQNAQSPRAAVYSRSTTGNQRASKQGTAPQSIAVPSVIPP